MKREVTIQKALTVLAAAKIEIESMQQQLVLKDKLLSSKEEKINLQLFTINQQKEELKQKDEEIKNLKSDNNSKTETRNARNPTSGLLMADQKTGNLYYTGILKAGVRNT